MKNKSQESMFSQYLPGRLTSMHLGVNSSKPASITVTPRKREKGKKGKSIVVPTFPVQCSFPVHFWKQNARAMFDLMEARKKSLSEEKGFPGEQRCLLLPEFRENFFLRTAGNQKSLVESTVFVALLSPEKLSESFVGNPQKTLEDFLKNNLFGRINAPAEDLRIRSLLNQCFPVALACANKLLDKKPNRCLYYFFDTSNTKKQLHFAKFFLLEGEVVYNLSEAPVDGFVRSLIKNQYSETEKTYFLVPFLTSADYQEALKNLPKPLSR